MTKHYALDILNNFFMNGFIDEATYKAKVARVEQIASNNKMHYVTKNNRYLAVVEMTKHGL